MYWTPYLFFFLVHPLLLRFSAPFSSLQSAPSFFFPLLPRPICFYFFFFVLYAFLVCANVPPREELDIWKKLKVNVEVVPWSLNVLRISFYLFLMCILVIFLCLMCRFLLLFCEFFFSFLNVLGSIYSNLKWILEFYFFHYTIQVLIIITGTNI